MNVARWLETRRGGEAVAVVLGASVNGLSFARSLGRRGVPVILVDSARSIGLYSRYAKSVALPRDASDETMLGVLDAIGARLDRPAALFPTSDASCLLVAEHRPRLERHFRFLLPDRDTVARIVDKSAQYEVARAAGVPLPVTCVPRSAAELEEAGRTVRYPALLKPFRSHRRPAAMRDPGMKVMVAGSAAELRAAYDRAVAMQIDVVLQEVVPGDDSAIYGYWGFWDAVGRERAWVTRRKIRQSPPGFGDGSVQQTVDAPEVAELSRRLLRAFAYRGFAGVEFKRDARDGTLRLIELNARTESGNQLAISAGVDLPWIGYCDLVGDVGAIDAVARPGVQLVNEEWDLKAFLALRALGELSLRDWVRSLRGTTAFAFGAWDDPAPLVVLAVRIGRAGLRRLVRRRRPA